MFGFGTVDLDTGKSRVYGGDPRLVHIKDGTRKELGETFAAYIDAKIRHEACENGKVWQGPLCPGCYMIALFNAAICLAQANGQPISELGNTLSQAFARLAANPESGLTEEIDVILDPDGGDHRVVS